MREIESIEKATLTRKFKDGSESGSGQGYSSDGIHYFSHLLPTTPIDQVVIRSVKWNGSPNDAENIYGLLVKSHQLIALVRAPDCVFFPRPLPFNIQIESPLEELEFVIMHNMRNKSQNAFIEGEIEIDMEFITYKKNH